jgi:hypothetical protein
MSDHDPKTRPSAPAPDPGDATPPHGDELRHESTFGRSDRYANQDDPESQPRPTTAAVACARSTTRPRRTRGWKSGAGSTAPNSGQSNVTFAELAAKLSLH